MSKRLWVWGALLVVAAAGTGLAPAAQAADDFVLGSGNGIATGVRVGPQTGGLTVAVTFGQALADFQGRVGRASARAIDFGILETALTAPGCNGAPSSFKQSDFPQPLDADSRDPESVKGKAQAQGGNNPTDPIFATVGRNEVQADGQPSSRATSTIAGFALTGVLNVSGGRAEVKTRIIKDATREVVGTVDFANVDLLGGAIQLKGLHWEAIQRTGKDGVNQGSFSAAAILVGGVPLTGGDSNQAKTVLAPVNALLLGTGLSLDPPALDTSDGVASITPLRLRIDHSPLGQALVAPLVTAAQPVRQPVLDLYSQAFDCAAPIGSQEIPGKVGRGAILPSDIALSALTGTGGFVIEIGGVRATTEGQTYADPFAGGGAAAGLGGSDLSLSGGSSDVAFSATGSDTGATTTGAPPPTTGGGTAPAAVLAGRTLPDGVGGAKGGAAATIGILAVLTILSVAVADYLRMQRGQRVIPEVE